MRRSFLERWVLLNIALLLAHWLMLNNLLKFGDPMMHGKSFRHLLYLIPALVFFPINGIFIFGSLYIHVMNKWYEHRVFWIIMLFLGVGWAYGFLVVLGRYPRI